MPGRKYSAANGYKYGFNGKENDKETGEGVQDYGMRIYDGRIAKFLSVDPLIKDYPELTPYQFAGNMPIAAIDLDGLEPTSYLALWKNTDGYHDFGNYYKNPGQKIEFIDGYYVSSYSFKGKDNSQYTWYDEKTNTWQKFTPANAKLNSDETAKGRDEQNKISGVRKITNSDIGRVLAYGNAVINECVSASTAALTESTGAYGLLDFKNVGYDLLGISRNDNVEIDGTVYNANEFGNFIWGALLEMSSNVDASFAANTQTIISQRRLDEPYDQKAINKGEALGSAVNFASQHMEGGRCKNPQCYSTKPQKDTRAGKIAASMTNAATNGTATNDLNTAKKIKKQKDD